MIESAPLATSVATVEGRPLTDLERYARHEFGHADATWLLRLESGCKAADPACEEPADWALLRRLVRAIASLR